MHQLIRIIVEAYSYEDAVGLARSCFEGQNPPLIGPYDYGRFMPETDGYVDNLPDVVSKKGAIKANTDAGMELIESGWEQTKAEFARELAVVKAGIEQLDDEAIFADRLIEADCEPYNPLGLAASEDEFAGTHTGHIRHSMYRLGSYAGSQYYLYRQSGEAVRTPADCERLLDDIETTQKDDYDWYVVPTDVHY